MVTDLWHTTSNIALCFLLWETPGTLLSAEEHSGGTFQAGAQKHWFPPVVVQHLSLLLLHLGTNFLLMQALPPDPVFQAQGRSRASVPIPAHQEIFAYPALTLLQP